jgi:hypothetical protein
VQAVSQTIQTVGGPDWKDYAHVDPKCVAAVRDVQSDEKRCEAITRAFLEGAAKDFAKLSPRERRTAGEVHHLAERHGYGSHIDHFHNKINGTFGEFMVRNVAPERQREILEKARAHFVRMLAIGSQDTLIVPPLENMEAEHYERGKAHLSTNSFWHDIFDGSHILLTAEDFEQMGLADHDTVDHVRKMFDQRMRTWIGDMLLETLNGLRHSVQYVYTPQQQVPCPEAKSIAGIIVRPLHPYSVLRKNGDADIGFSTENPPNRAAADEEMERAFCRELTDRFNVPRGNLRRVIGRAIRDVQVVETKGIPTPLPGWIQGYAGSV